MSKLIVDNGKSTSLAFNHPMVHGMESNLIKANGIDSHSPFWSAGSLLTNLTKSTPVVLSLAS
jgi:hypothetical protein